MLGNQREQWPNALILLTFNQARATDTAEQFDCAATEADKGRAALTTTAITKHFAFCC